jgi:hypothetical protein
MNHLLERALEYHRIPASAAPLAGVAASMPASAFAFRGSGELPRELARKPDTAHPCTYGNDSKHNASSRNEARDIFDPCIRQCVSKGASSRHNEELQGNDRPRADI